MQTGLSTTQMQDQTTFSGWDFTTIWVAPNTGNYPTLKWMAQP